MIDDCFRDLLDETGEIAFRGWRCVHCGEIVDPVIMSNRIRQALLSNRARHDMVIAVGAWKEDLLGNEPDEGQLVGAGSGRGSGKGW